ncbi:unnamed protein product [Effrenium voratum]|nr:unnamed protein product [Effrenium voratum]
MHQVTGHKKAPTACAFSASGHCMATGGRDNLVLTWACSATAPSPPPTERAPPVPAERVPPARSGKPTQARHPVSTPERAAPVATERAVPAPRRKEEPKEPEVAEAGTEPLEPSPVMETLKSMQSQLEMMSRTILLLDQRLALNEEQVSAMRAELLQKRAATAAKPEPLKTEAQLLAPSSQEEELRRELESLRQLL